MNNHQIDVIEPHGLKRTFNRSLGVLIGFDTRVELRGNEKFVASDAAFTDTFTDASFILIGLCGVDVAIANFYSLFDRIGHDVVFDHPGSETELGDLNAVWQGVSFIQNHRCSFLRVLLRAVILGGASPSGSEVGAKFRAITGRLLMALMTRLHEWFEFASSP